MKKTLLKGGTVVTGSSVRKADILIEGERIAKVMPVTSFDPEKDVCGCPKRGPECGSKCVSDKVSYPDAEVVDCTGKLLFPGFIDTHTHFQMQAKECVTADDFDSGTRAALAGGTTTILDFTTQNKGESLMLALDRWHRMADGHSSCNYSFHMSITDWNPLVRKELPLMTEEGITSYKVYMAYKNLRISDLEIYEIMQAVADEGGIIGTHCENGDLIDAVTASLRAKGMMGTDAHPIAHSREIEAEAVNRYLTIAHEAGVPINIVHLSTKQGLEFVRMVRKTGQKVCIETCPQYFLLDDSLYSLPDFEGAKYVFSPPARKKEDQDALWDAIRHGEIDTIGTDHCSFNFETEKKIGIDDFTRIPNGIPGVETRPVLMFTYGVKQGRMSNQSFCRLMAENAAKEYGMYPAKGVLQEGSDADIVVWDPNYKWTITAEHQVQNVDYTPYEGREVFGRPEKVYLHGDLVVKDAQVIKKDLGHFVSRGPADLSFRN